jgi:hypothetical protein
MTHEIQLRREAWAQALLSRRYTQGSGYLRSGDGAFCCLGVACDVFRPDGWEFRPAHYIGEPDASPTHPWQSAGDAFLNDEALDYLGLTTDQQLALAALNDAFPPTPFEEIAEIILDQDKLDVATAAYLEKRKQPRIYG